MDRDSQSHIDCRVSPSDSYSALPTYKTTSPLSSSPALPPHAQGNLARMPRTVLVEHSTEQHKNMDDVPGVTTLAHIYIEGASGIHKAISLVQMGWYK
ncbi:hypothetical protein NPIL_370991 [Nephila pilipes]|uniref:Uncharacterized protein n=1 Tax=Nephila pilipes TaxID=299642 RepID=A0A8X6QE15_NEPPI|nr:hypothetical protein NPIL_370991 [Nephila pilipes]